MHDIVRFAQGGGHNFNHLCAMEQRHSSRPEVIVVASRLAAAQSLGAIVEAMGRKAICVTSPGEVEPVVEAGPPSVIVIEWDEYCDALAVCKRYQGQHIPAVVVLLRNDAAVSVLDAFRAGAIDVWRRPISVSEFHVRLDQLINRLGIQRRHSTIRIGSCEVDPTTGAIRIGDNVVVMSEMERRAMKLLVAKAGRCVTSTELSGALWGAGRTEVARLRMVIHRLRTLLGDSGDRHKRLVSVRGKGYVLIPEVASQSPYREKKSSA